MRRRPPGCRSGTWSSAWSRTRPSRRSRTRAATLTTEGSGSLTWLELVACRMAFIVMSLLQLTSLVQTCVVGMEPRVAWMEAQGALHVLSYSHPNPCIFPVLAAVHSSFGSGERRFILRSFVEPDRFGSFRDPT